MRVHGFRTYGFQPVMMLLLSGLKHGKSRLRHFELHSHQSSLLMLPNNLQSILWFLTVMTTESPLSKAPPGNWENLSHCLLC